MAESKKVKSERGGKRPGSGRPVKSGSRRIVLRQVAMTTETWAKIQAIMEPNESMGDFVERYFSEMSKNPPQPGQLVQP